jgi:hypothetical protein
MALEDEVEADLDDLVARCTGMGMRERVAGGLELVEEAPRDGEVEAAKLGSERLDLEDGKRWRHRGCGHLIWDSRVGTRKVRRRTPRKGEHFHRRRRCRRREGGGATSLGRECARGGGRNGR